MINTLYPNCAIKISEPFREDEYVFLVGHSDFLDDDYDEENLIQCLSDFRDTTGHHINNYDERVSIHDLDFYEELYQKRCESLAKARSAKKGKSIEQLTKEFLEKRK